MNNKHKKIEAELEEKTSKRIKKKKPKVKVSGKSVFGLKEIIKKKGGSKKTL